MPALASALLAIALYAVTLDGTWIYDDVGIVRDDPRLLDAHQWHKYLTQGYSDGADRLWRPLTSLSFAVQWKLTGPRAWPLHLVNILLHALASALVAALAWKLGGRRCAWIAGPLFAAHPLHVEAVAYLVGRAETLASIGLLGGLVLFIRPIGKPLTYPRVTGVFICFLIAIFSKEQGLLFPFTLLVWNTLTHWKTALRLRRDKITGRGRFPSVTENGTGTINSVRGGRRPRAGGPQRVMILLLTWVMSAYIVYREHILPWSWDTYFLDWTINPLKLSHGADRWLVPVSILGRYASLLVLPWRLSPDYSASVFLPTFQWDDPYFFLGIAASIAYLAACAVALRRRSAPAVFCLACMGLSYFLVSNVILIGTIFGERLMYLPSAFFLILFALGIERGLSLLSVRKPDGTPTVPVADGLQGDAPISRLRFAIALVVLLAAASWRTVTYAARWTHALSFYKISFREQPRSVQLGLLLAMELRQANDLDRSAQVLAQVRAQTPDYWKAWYLSALVAMERNDLDEADRDIRRAADIDPTWVTALPLPREIQEKRQKATSRPVQ